MLELYHNNMSVCAQKVRLVIKEKGIEAVEHHLNLRAGDQQKPEYVKLNPKAYVPTVVHDGAVVTESAIICEYLDEAFPDPPLRPGTPAGRAYMKTWTRRPDAGLHDACQVITNAIAFRHQWLARPADELARTIANTPDPVRRERRRDLIENGTRAASFREAVWTYDAVLADMEAALAGRDWLAGDAYTLADVSLTPYVHRLAALALDRLWQPDRPRVGDWYARIKARANFAAAIGAYDEAGYLTLMDETGRAAWPEVAAALAAR